MPSHCNILQNNRYIATSLIVDRDWVNERGMLCLGGGMHSTECHSS